MIRCCLYSLRLWEAGGRAEGHCLGDTTDMLRVYFIEYAVDSKEGTGY